MIKFHKASKGAEIPKRATEGAAGFDLFANSLHDIRPMDRTVINTGITVEIPPNAVGIIKPRSGLAVRNGIDVMAGVIDSDYRGEVKVLLINQGEELFKVRPGDRIAQILFMPIITASETGGKLSETERGCGGFGSTGA